LVVAAVTIVLVSVSTAKESAATIEAFVSAVGAVVTRGGKPVAGMNVAFARTYPGRVEIIQ
jgi:hypothetical protein